MGQGKQLRRSYIPISTKMKTDVKKIIISNKEARLCLPKRPKDCQKGDFGYVALIGGSLEYSGAIRLAAMANSAMRSGAGVASVAAPKSICPIIAERILEATLIPLSEKDGNLVFSEGEFEKICKRYDVIAFGMGVGLSDESIKAAEHLISSYERTLIIDADGLNALSKLGKEKIRSSKAKLILTPHMKEFSRLSGMEIDEIKKDPGKAALDLSEELNAIVLLKGSSTYVAEPPNKGISERRLFVSESGCPGMATAGSGDVLSGVLSAICAYSEDPALATAAGAYINGLAGEIAQKKRSDITMTASDTALCIAEAIESIAEAE